MRYEDWAFRETEVHLAEPRELRGAVGVQGVADYTPLYRFLRRLDGVVFEAALSEMSRYWQPAGEKRRASVAVDATGLTPGAISIVFVKRVKDREPDFTWRPWVKRTVTIDMGRLKNAFGQACKEHIIEIDRPAVIAGLFTRCGDAPA